MPPIASWRISAASPKPARGRPVPPSAPGSAGEFRADVGSESVIGSVLMFADQSSRRACDKRVPGAGRSARSRASEPPRGRPGPEALSGRRRVRLPGRCRLLESRPRRRRSRRGDGGGGTMTDTRVDSSSTGTGPGSTTGAEAGACPERPRRRDRSFRSCRSRACRSSRSSSPSSWRRSASTGSGGSTSTMSPAVACGPASTCSSGSSSDRSSGGSRSRPAPSSRRGSCRRWSSSCRRWSP